MIDLIFCLPGNPSSQIQALNVFYAMNNLMSEGITVAIRHSTANNIYAVRNACLSTQGHKRYQKPFEGTPYENYGHIVWIDSDNIVSADNIKRLLSHKEDIVAGWYFQNHGKDTISCGRIETGNVKPESFNAVDMIPQTDLISVDYSGMGLMVVKKGVFEQMTYPWFESWRIDWEEDGEEMSRIVMDDECFCIKAKRSSFDIWVDPLVRIQHEKVGMI